MSGLKKKIHQPYLNKIKSKKVFFENNKIKNIPI